MNDPRTKSEPPPHDFPLDARALVEQLPTAAAVLQGPDLTFAATSAEYRRVIGGRDPMGQPIREVLPELAEQGFMDLIHRAYRTGEPVSGVEVPVAWDSDGDGIPEECFFDFSYSPLRNISGRVSGIVVQVADATERVRADRERAFLAEASDLLASSLDYDATLSSVTHLAVQAMADWCAVDELAPNGTIRRIAVAHPDPRKVEFARQLQERYPPDPDAPQGVHQVLRTGKAEFMSEIPDELLVAATQDEEHLHLIRELGLRSYITVPLIARGHTLGALTLVAAESGRRYGPRELRLAEELAGRAAIAVDNARLFRHSEQSRTRLEEQAIEMEEQAVELEERTEELQVIQAELEEANEELQRANREAALRAEQAEEARAEAEEANRAKTEFLSAMSHELRTPLNAIAGYVDILDLGVHGALTDAQRVDLGRIKRAQEVLLGLITDVLNFARLEAGRMEYRTEPVPLAPLLDGLESIVEPQVQAKGLGYRCTGCDDGWEALGDPDRIRQILLNLLTNAVKFTPLGGEVELSLEARNDQIYIHVRDTGRGIEPEKLESIFDPFVQVDRHRTEESQQGVGLGLAISRELARGMDGEITAESAPGIGSRFTLVLPMAS